jgi:hypothetical protein
MTQISSIEAGDADIYYACDVVKHARGIIQVFAMPNGKYASSGLGYDIEDNKDHYCRRVVFDTREAALRAAVARFIRLCRAASRLGISRHLESKRCLADQVGAGINPPPDWPSAARLGNVILSTIDITFMLPEGLLA